MTPDGIAGRRIALFSGNYNCVRDGANQALNRLVEHLLNCEAHVRVYSPTIALPAFEPAGTLISCPSVSIPGRSEYRLALGLPVSTQSDLASFNPDLIHLSSPDLLGWAAQRWARKRAIPIVASLHTRFETYLDYYGFGWAREIAGSYLHRFYEAADWLLVPNVPIKEELDRSDLRTPTSIWSRGVDARLFSPTLRSEQWRRANGYSDDEPVLLYFGRMVREKGLDDFVAAVALLRTFGCPLRPLCIGEGPDRNSMHQQLPDAIFTGHLSGNDLGRAVASADIFLNPSQTEAFGNVTLEAMASGVAVVSGATSSASALVEHGRSALLVPPGDIAAMAGAVQELITRPSLRRLLASAALGDSRRFSWTDVLDAVVTVYVALIDARTTDGTRRRASARRRR